MQSNASCAFSSLVWFIGFSGSGAVYSARQSCIGHLAYVVSRRYFARPLATAMQPKLPAQDESASMKPKAGIQTRAGQQQARPGVGWSGLLEVVWISAV